MEPLKRLISHTKTKSFVDNYQATDAEAMGLIVSKYFEWDGLQILEVSAAALEDANFHAEADAVRYMLQKAKAE